MNRLMLSLPGNEPLAAGRRSVRNRVAPNGVLLSKEKAKRLRMTLIAGQSPYVALGSPHNKKFTRSVAPLLLREASARQDPVPHSMKQARH